MAAPQASSRLEMLQARFQQKQLQEKEQKLLRLYDQQQQRAYQVVKRGSAGSNASSGGSSNNNNYSGVTTATTVTNRQSVTRTTSSSSSSSVVAGHTTSTSHVAKVRQMLNERQRQTTGVAKGIDRSYPLEPLENKPRKRSIGRNTGGGNKTETELATRNSGDFDDAVSNGKQRSLANAKRASDVNSNNVNGKIGVVVPSSYRVEENNDGTGIENGFMQLQLQQRQKLHYVNGNDRNEVGIREGGMDEDTILRNRTMAKLHLMDYDVTMKHRVRNDLESEEFPEHLLIEDEPSRKNAISTRKTQAEARLERFRNVNSKRNNGENDNNGAARSNANSNVASAKRRSEVAPPSDQRMNHRNKATSSKSTMFNNKKQQSEQTARKERKLEKKEDLENRKTKRQYEKKETTTTMTTDIEAKKIGFTGRKVEKTRKVTSPTPSVRRRKVDDKEDASLAINSRFFGKEPEARRTAKMRRQTTSQKNFKEREKLLPPPLVSPSTRKTAEVEGGRIARSSSCSPPNSLSPVRLLASPDSIARMEKKKVPRRRSSSDDNANGNATSSDITKKNISRSSSRSLSPFSPKRISKSDGSEKTAELSSKSSTKSKYEGTKEKDDNDASGKRPNYFCRETEKSATTYLIDRDDHRPLGKEEIKKKRKKEQEVEATKERNTKGDREQVREFSVDSPEPQQQRHLGESDTTKKRKTLENLMPIKSAQLIRDLVRINKERDWRSSIDRSDVTSSGYHYTGNKGYDKPTESSINRSKYQQDFYSPSPSPSPSSFSRSRRNSKRSSPETARTATTTGSPTPKHETIVTRCWSSRNSMTTTKYGENLEISTLDDDVETTKTKEERRDTTKNNPKGYSPKSPKSFASSPEVDTEVQEITMSDQYVEYQKERFFSSSPSPDSFSSMKKIENKTREGSSSSSSSSTDFRKTYTKSTIAKFDEDYEKSVTRKNGDRDNSSTFTYLVRRETRKNRPSLWASDIFLKGREKIRSMDQERSVGKIDMENKSAVVSLKDITIGGSTDFDEKDDIMKSAELIRSTIKKSQTELTSNMKMNNEGRFFYGRTDSVESALKRFDSIGAHALFHDEIGRDTIDRCTMGDCRFTVENSEMRVTGKEEKPIIGKTKTKTKKKVNKEKEPKDFGIPDSPKLKSVSRQSGNKNGRPAICLLPSVHLQQISGKARKKTKGITEERQINIKIQNEEKKRTEKEETKKGENKMDEIRSARKTKMAFSERQSPFCKRRLFVDSEDDDGEKFDERREKMKVDSKSLENLLELGTRAPSVKQLRSIEDIKKSIRSESLNSTTTSPTIDNCKVSTKFSTMMKSKIGGKEKSKVTTTRKFGKQSRLSRDDKENLSHKKNSRVDRITTTTTSYPSSDPILAKTRDSSATYAKKLVSSLHSNGATVDHKHPSKENAKNREAPAKLTTGGKNCTRTTISDKSSFDVKYDDVDSRTAMTENVSQSHRTFGSTATDQRGGKMTTQNTTKRTEAFVVDLSSGDSNDKSSSKKSMGKIATPSEKQQQQQRQRRQQQQTSSSFSTTSVVGRTASSSIISPASRGSGTNSISVSKEKRMATKVRTPISKSAINNPACVDPLAPCKVCGRRFAQERIGLHEQICQKASQKKRKIFDTVMHRVKGTDLEAFTPKKPTACFPRKAAEKPKKPDPKSNWRKKHEEFINAIRCAKQAQAHLAAGGKLSDLPPPPLSDTSDYIQCPHCGRKFNEAAAERHIPKCQNMLHNKPSNRPPPRPRR